MRTHGPRVSRFIELIQALVHHFPRVRFSHLPDGSVKLICRNQNDAWVPEQIVSHPLGHNIVRVPLEEPGLPLTVGAIIQSSSAISPAIRHFITHLHRAAHQLNVTRA